jgi:hypothetical protein
VPAYGEPSLELTAAAPPSQAFKENFAVHAVDLLDEAIRVAMDSGIEVRQEWLDERGGGACRIGRRQVLFLDLSQTAQEQLETIISSLRQTSDLRIDKSISSELKSLLK